MHSITGATIALACCAFSTIAHAEDVYSGNTVVQNEGRNAAFCNPSPVKITIADGRFSFGYGSVALATGTVATDGAFSGSFSNSGGPTGRVTTNVSVTGHIQDGKITGSTSNSNGCVQNFTLTK
jgi:hypothetical protein